MQYKGLSFTMPQTRGIKLIFYPFALRIEWLTHFRVVMLYLSKETTVAVAHKQTPGRP